MENPIYFKRYQEESTPKWQLKIVNMIFPFHCLICQGGKKVSLVINLESQEPFFPFDSKVSILWFFSCVESWEILLD